ncbi:MAG TPA: metallophosphoesterase family protein [Candidatus Methanofastidiosa archaeon]|nr:metallophosphoesterase family protein [Candidatus Methanofastidiosa archaeon]
MRVLAISDIHGRTLDKADEIADGYDLTLIAGDITHFGGYQEAKCILDDFIRGRKVLSVFGNCDNTAVGEYLSDAGISVHNELRTVDGYKISGFSGAPRSRFDTPGEFDDDEIGGGIVRWDGDMAMVLTHVPAYDTRLDYTPKAGHIGSRSVRTFIEEKAPLIHICGHVHESRGMDSIGNTLLVNPGPFFQGCYAEIDIGDEVRCSLREF